MHMEAEAGPASERTACGEEIVAAVERDRRRQRQPRLGRVEGPARDDALERGQGLGSRREAKSLRHLPLRRRQGVEEAINGLIEGMVGDHGREHNSQPGVTVAASGRFQPLETRHGELVEEVIAGRRARPDHVEATKKAAEILVLQRPMTVEVGTCIEKKLERPAVARTLPQMAMSVCVRIDEAGQEQAVGGIDQAGSCRRLKARRPDLANRVARHQNVGWLRGVAPDVKDFGRHGRRYNRPVSSSAHFPEAP